MYKLSKSGLLSLYNMFRLSSGTFFYATFPAIFQLSVNVKKKFWEELIAYFPWYGTDHIENDSSNNSSIACVFATAVTFLPSRCLATKRGYTYRHTDWWEGFFNYVIEVGSGAVIHVPSFIKIGSGIQKLIGGIHTQTATRSHKPPFFFQNKESRLKIIYLMMA
jgi:hypothetical protein